MIKLLLGQPGSGKTKDMIKHANSAVETAKGHIVFIDESNEAVLKVHRKIRYINISEFPIESSNEFIGFLHGLVSNDYDIQTIYIDGVLNIYIMTPKEICAWLDRIKLIADKYNILFEISISHSGDTPECFKPYLKA